MPGFVIILIILLQLRVGGFSAPSPKRGSVTPLKEPDPDRVKTLNKNAATMTILTLRNTAHFFRLLGDWVEHDDETEQEVRGY